ncbi:hypothetical protein BJX76DRAFT_357182 [Aspergillus varians]
MVDWDPTPFIVGSIDPSSFPMALFSDVNAIFKNQFALDGAIDVEQVTVWIVMMLVFAGASTQITLDDEDRCEVPTDLDSGGFTYRGIGEAYTCSFDAAIRSLDR